MSQPTQEEVILAEQAKKEAAPGPETEYQGLSQGQIVRKRFFGHSGALVGLAVFALIFIMAFTSVGFAGIPGWWKYNHVDVSPLVNDGVPSVSLWPLAWGEHPFGQDRIGRDLFAMTMRGAQQSIIIMVIIGAIAGLIGAVVGGLAGYFRGWVEAILMRLTDVIIIIPVLLLAAVVAQMANRRDAAGWFSAFAASNGVVVLGIFLGLVSWVGLARLVRGEFLTLREREFVDAARISGASNARIIFKHILPNAIGVLIVNVTLTMSAAILLETALSYLGVGVKSPDTSLGLLISQNQEAFATRPWLFWYPGLFIVAICLSINFIGDGLRDAFDPRQKKFRAKSAVETGRHSSETAPSSAAPGATSTGSAVSGSPADAGES
ncbi:ABC transporter permease [Arthrobacter cupressi]|uniref:Peptide/nickel transport system permease protein n=1 Tax=Arthrobacter cupressi TaxID=1045773 RepID=A0A1G8PF73_9MICC|nr:ABC transporter permease [Arthrobacter cupressi]NYD76820.1 peptide/nickel transport system permease protein [Arthrobacter cupressi]SDI91067.1 peptide/nickel transport system permease protein [Arthrobacter cupressi]